MKENEIYLNTVTYILYYLFARFYLHFNQDTILVSCLLLRIHLFNKTKEILTFIILTLRNIIHFEKENFTKIKLWKKQISTNISRNGRCLSIHDHNRLSLQLCSQNLLTYLLNKILETSKGREFRFWWLFCLSLRPEQLSLSFLEL